MSVTKQADGQFHLVGSVSEHMDLEPLAEEPGVLALNFQAVTTISSLGSRKLKHLLDAKLADGVEYHECQRWMVDMLNALPVLTDAGDKRVNVVSVYTPYRCNRCSLSVDVLIDTTKVKLSRDDVEVPPAKCHQCHQSMECEVDPYDYFLFLGVS